MFTEECTPTYDDLLEEDKAIDFSDIVLMSEGAYRKEDGKDPIHLHMTKYKDIVSDTTFINCTNLDLLILHGGCGKAVLSRRGNYYGMKNEFIIKATISPENERTLGQSVEQIITRDRKVCTTRDVRRYIITEETLRDQPVYIEELNVVIVKADMRDRVNIPTRADSLREVARTIRKEVHEELQRTHAYFAYVEVPREYRGPKTFYLVVNNEIQRLPVFQERILSLEHPSLIVLTREGKRGQKNERKVPLNPIEIKNNPYIVDGEREYLISTDYDTLVFYMETNQFSRIEVEKENKLLKRKIKNLEEENKTLSSRLHLEGKDKDKEIDKKELIDFGKTAGLIIGGILSAVIAVIAKK